MKYDETINRMWKDMIKKNLEELQEAVALYRHLKAHPEVINAPLHEGEPMCKICNKTAKEILKDFLKERESKDNEKSNKL